MTVTSHSDRRSTWDATKQQQYRDRHPDQTFVWHFLLDASPSMIPYADALCAAYTRYLRFLQRTAPPMSVAETRCFAETCPKTTVQALGSLPALTRTQYRPEDGDGTAIYNAIGQCCTEVIQQGQHVLVVFTDGADCAAYPTWTAASVHELLTTLQAQSGWLCVYLGAHAEALQEGKAMGFHAKNILTFATEKIPDAFQRLQDATQQYLQAGQAERKLLAQGGIFTG